RFDQRHQVVGIGIHVVAVPGLGRSAMAAAVMRDAAKPALAEVEHLRIPIIRAQRPAMAEHNRLPRAPVLVIDLRAIFSRDGAHRALSFVSYETSERFESCFRSRSF